ncbi:MAG: hypothetical protein AB7Q23_09890 [Hyphomonadaceae bacterium]
MRRRKGEARAVAKPPIQAVPKRGFLSAFQRVAPDQPIHTESVCRIFIKEGWGIQELESDVVGDLPIREFERDNRADVQTRMKAYFADEIDMFYAQQKSDRQKRREVRLYGAAREEEDNEFPILPHLHPLKDAFAFATTLGLIVLAAIVGVFAYLAVSTQIYWIAPLAAASAVACIVTARLCWRLVVRASHHTWPGFMEERLANTIEDRFPKDDTDVRRLVDRFGELFLNNNWMYARLKRLFQAIAILGFHVAAAPLALMALSGNLWTWGALGVAGASAWAAIVVLVSLWIFFGMTDHIYRDKYYQSLQNSAQDVANAIRDRLSAINQIYQHTLTHMADIHATGEQIKTHVDPDILEDIDLKDHTSFFDTQKLIWLAKRLEYIELYLQSRLHSVHTLHSALATTGFVASTSLMLLGCIPAALVLVHLGTTIPRVAWTDGATLSAFAPLLAAAVIVPLLTMWVSQQSFGNRKWNSMATSHGSTILEDYFNPKVLDGWQTYNKRQLDVNLAGRFQKAMFRIQSYFDKMGRH